MVVVTQGHPKLTQARDCIEVAERVTSDGACVFKLRDDGQYDVRPAGTGYGVKRGWVTLDSFSASAMLTVFKALNEVNQAKFRALHVTKAAGVAFKFIR
jgi:hypothetical protein